MFPPIGPGPLVVVGTVQKTPTSTDPWIQPTAIHSAYCDCEVSNSYQGTVLGIHEWRQVMRSFSLYFARIINNYGALYSLTLTAERKMRLIIACVVFATWSLNPCRGYVWEHSARDVSWVYERKWSRSDSQSAQCCVRIDITIWVWGPGYAIQRSCWDPPRKINAANIMARPADGKTFNPFTPNIYSDQLQISVFWKPK